MPRQPVMLSPLAVNPLVMGTFFLAPFACATPGNAAPVDLNHDVLRFDAGPARSTIESGAGGLSLETSYTPDARFGWTESPRAAFQRPELSRSRGALTIDGVAGNRLGFRADVSSGTWFLTLWAEAGREDLNNLNLLIQGQQQSLGWHAFRPPVEPQSSAPKTYRVFHGTTRVGAEGLTFRLTGSQDEVRVLGVSLIRQVDANKATHPRLMEQLAMLGRYNSSESLEELAKQVGDSLRRNPTDAFLAVWHVRLKLLALAERYLSMRGWEWADAETGLGMFDRLQQAVMLCDALLITDLHEPNPLTERVLYTRGRILYWLGEEGGAEDDITAAQRDLTQLYASHPDDSLLAMYTGEKIDLPDACDCLQSAPDAPAWSVAQREASCRIRQLVHWWVHERQRAGGEFGGKLGDDVELLRWWAPLVLSGDKTAQRGWQRLADGVWQSRHILEGYARKLRDVEHASEFIADTAPLMAIVSDDPRYVNRLAYSARHFDNLWTGVTAKGHRFFRSAWFSATEVVTAEPKGRDLEYNSRAVQAMRYLAWRRADPKVVQLLHEWSTAWVSAALRTDKGKPPGIIPASVRFTDEAINGDELTWHRANMFWSYYDWEHFAGSMMLDQLLFTYMLTGDKQLLVPMLMTLDLIRAEEDQIANTRSGSLDAGSRAWAADRLLRSELFWSVVQQWRFLSEDSRWDDLIMRHGTPYGRYRLSGDESHLTEGLYRLLKGVRYNTPLKTTEVIHTDRVYVRGYEHLKAMLSGDGIWANLSPYFAATWEQTDDNFTALVSDSGRDRLQVTAYSHAPDERQIVMRIWQLAPGAYRLQVESPGQGSRKVSVTVKERGQRIPITLPSRQVLRIRLERDSS